VLFVILVVDRLKEFEITSDAAAVFRWTGSLALKA
jgi:hypothetical protein